MRRRDVAEEAAEAAGNIGSLRIPGQDKGAGTGKTVPAIAISA